MATARSHMGERETALPPVSRAHQEGLRSLIQQLDQSGQDVGLLRQLADSLPHLRAGLSAADRRRVDELDANDLALRASLEALQSAVDSFGALIDVPEPSLLIASLLVEGAPLRRLGALAHELAEAANELALRASVRAGLLE